MPDETSDDLPESFERAESVSAVFEQVLVLNTALAAAQRERASVDHRPATLPDSPADGPADLAGADVEPALQWLDSDAEGLFQRVRRVIEQVEENMAALASGDEVDSYTISVGMSISGPTVTLSVTYSDAAESPAGEAATGGKATDDGSDGPAPGGA